MNDVIDILEIPSGVIAKASYGERGRDAARVGARHGFEDHRMAVAGDELIGRELVHQPLEQREEPSGLGAIGTRFVVVARQEQRDRYASDVVVHAGRFAAPPMRPRRAADGIRAGARTLLREVFFDREGTRASNRAVVRT